MVAIVNGNTIALDMSICCDFGLQGCNPIDSSWFMVMAKGVWTVNVSKVYINRSASIEPADYAR